MANVAGRSDASQPDSGARAGVAKAALTAGGGFATTIATLLGVAGFSGLANETVLLALLAVSVIAALTLFTAAFLARR